VIQKLEFKKKISYPTKYEFDILKFATNEVNQHALNPIFFSFGEGG
jgi:hypothetical protein